MKNKIKVSIVVEYDNKKISQTTNHMSIYDTKKLHGVDLFDRFVWYLFTRVKYCTR
jgi:hypothetical protein